MGNADRTKSILAFALFGPPGCGKGTQAALIQEHLGFIHVSTGDMFRNAIARKDPIALEAQEIMQRGDLVSDEIIRDMLTAELKNILKENPNPHGFILDGFPRTVKQAELLEGIVESLHFDFKGAIGLTVPRDLLVERLLNRTTDGAKRADDTEDVILERMRIYEEKTQPLIDYYENLDQMITIDGVGTIEEIFERIKPIISGWENG